MPVFLTSELLAIITGREGVWGGRFTNELQASGAYSDGGGTRVGHKEDGFKEQIIRPLGAVINCKMALKDSTEKISREGQMGGMVNN